MDLAEAHPAILPAADRCSRVAVCIFSSPWNFATIVVEDRHRVKDGKK
jgi:hypothetical protein